MMARDVLSLAFLPRSGAKDGGPLEQFTGPSPLNGWIGHFLGLHGRLNCGKNNWASPPLARAAECCRKVGSSALGYLWLRCLSSVPCRTSERYTLGDVCIFKSAMCGCVFVCLCVCVFVCLCVCVFVGLRFWGFGGLGAWAPKRPSKVPTPATAPKTTAVSPHARRADLEGPRRGPQRTNLEGPYG